GPPYRVATGLFPGIRRRADRGNPGLSRKHREDADVLRPPAPARAVGGGRHRGSGGMKHEQHHGPLEPQDVEELLPWYVTGRVSREEARGIEAAMGQNAVWQTALAAACVAIVALGVQLYNAPAGNQFDVAAKINNAGGAT